jgi:hypothetical protein
MYSIEPHARSARAFESFCEKYFPDIPDQDGTIAYTYLEVVNVKVGLGSYYYFLLYYQIAVNIKPLYLTHNACYLTSNTARVVRQN